jgi:ATP-dependent helicase HrpA
MSTELVTITYPEDLPIAAARAEIIDAISKHRVVIVAGDTGSGKSTQLPKMCLEAGQGATRLIGCTQPRRLAATSVAQRVAEELGPVGATLVGCKIRFSDRTTAETRIKFMTDGILLAETRRDRDLAAYDTIIIDEAHERSLNIDFLLGILRRLLERRRDLKLIITSATIDTARFAAAFGGAPVITVAGRTYPVELRYQPPETEGEEIGHVEQAVAAVLDLHRSEQGGDMLVFMPTERDIRDTVEGIEKGLGNGLDKAGATVLPLFGRLSARDQQRIFGPVNGRKIVVATNVAETSITVPGIRFVVDSGLARISVYNPRARTSKLPVRPVSRASADQRKGRCGRTGPGICVRLYSEEEYLGREEFTRPEIQRADLAEVILRMISLRLGDPVRFPFLDPPSPRAIRDGYQLLLELGAIEMEGDRSSARLTARGRIMAELPLDPRIARMIIEGREHQVLTEVCVIGAALSIPDPRVRPAEHEKEADRAHAAFAVAGSDFLSFLAIWAAVAKLSASQQRRFCRDNFLSWQRLREWRDIHEQLTSILARHSGFRFNPTPAHPDVVHRAILSGNLRNLGLRTAKNLYQSSQDKEVMIFPGSALYNKGGKWIMAAEVVETSRLFARCVANIEPEWIEPLAGHLCRYSWAEPHWERKRGQVVAFENVTLFGLLIEARRRVNYGSVKPDEARQIFIQQGLVEGEIGEELPFLAHNQALAARLEELEDRVRQRDILVDETTIFNFYEQRLPAEINDRTGLKKLLKRSGGDGFLRMREEDLLYRAPAAERLADYPETLDYGGFTLRLSYRFQPGAEDDGVSVHIPVELLPQVEPAHFDWLVPGLLPEKLLFLLKGLPKSLRRPLVPVPEAARRLGEALSFGAGNFYALLQEFLWKFYQVRVTRPDWPVADLPEHLRVRYCLEDRQGRLVKASRDFGQLTGTSGAAAAGSGGLLAGLRKRWERGGISSWDFAGLDSERLPIQGRDGLLLGYAFPGLEAEGSDTVRLRLFNDESERRRLTSRGMLILYAREFSGFKGLKKDFALGQEHWALLEGLGDRAELNRALLEFILIEVFGTRNGLIPKAEEFAAMLARVKDEGLYRLGRELFDQVVAVLRERRTVLDLLHRYESLGGRAGREKFADCRRHLDELLPPDFLDSFDSRRVRNLQRYLQVLARRVERAHVDPVRDRARAAQVLLHEERLAELAKRPLFTPAQRQLLEDFREMVEEFRVSLFAQEFKTLYPVSEKRLVAKWAEIREQVEI